MITTMKIDDHDNDDDDDDDTTTMMMMMNRRRRKRRRRKRKMKVQCAQFVRPLAVGDRSPSAPKPCSFTVRF